MSARRPARSGDRRRPDARSGRDALRQADRPRRSAGAPVRPARQGACAARRHRRGRARRGCLARHRDLAALDARLLRRLPGRLPGARGRWLAGVGGRLPARRRGRAAVRARSRATTSPSSGCRCCRCWASCAAVERSPREAAHFRRDAGGRRRRRAGRPLAEPADPQRLARGGGARRASTWPFAPPAEGFAAFVGGLRGGAVRGLNVTVPFKQAALALADDASVAARRAGAANLLLFEPDGRVSADNTDGAGLLAALAEQAPGFDARRGPAVILGAGGAARGAAAALLDAGAPEVRLINRTVARAEAIAQALGAGGARRCKRAAGARGRRADRQRHHARPGRRARSRRDVRQNAPERRGHGHGLSAAAHRVPGARRGGRPDHGRRPGDADRPGAPLVRGPVRRRRRPLSTCAASVSPRWENPE